MPGTVKVNTDFDLLSASKIKNMPQASAPGDPVEYSQWLAAQEAYAWKDNVRVCPQGNVNINSPGATLDTVNMAGQDRVLLRNQTTQTENGLYVWNGAAVPMTRTADASTFDELEGAVVTVDEGTDAGKSFRQTQVNGTLGTNNVLWTSYGTGAPAATETLAGVLEIATQAEADAGTDDLRAVTPLKAKTATWSKKDYTALVGDGSQTQFDVTHNLGKKTVSVTVFEESTGDQIICQVRRTDNNTVRLNFTVAPTASQYRVYVNG